MPTNPKPSEPRGRVLVVDDDAAVRVLLTEFLEQQNFEVCARSDGLKALGTFQREHFDLILVDFQMPGITGLEMAAEVRKTDPHIPIALITGTAVVLEPQAVEHVGINRIFPKPFSLDELSSWIRSLYL